MAEIRELRPALNRAVRHHLGISPVPNRHTAPRASLGTLSPIWKLHIGAFVLFLGGLLLLTLFGAL